MDVAWRRIAGKGLHLAEDILLVLFKDKDSFHTVCAHLGQVHHSIFSGGEGCDFLANGLPVIVRFIEIKGHTLQTAAILIHLFKGTVMGFLQVEFQLQIGCLIAPFHVKHGKGMHGVVGEGIALHFVVDDRPGFFKLLPDGGFHP